MGKPATKIKRAALAALAIVLALAVVELLLQGAHLLARSRAGAGADGRPVVLCIGDSHTYGAGVAAAETYPAQLEARLAAMGYKVRVVNEGAPGYNTSELRRRLPDWLGEWQPVMVIVLVSVNNGWNRADAAWSDQADGLPVPLSARVSDFIFTRLRLGRAFWLAAHRLEWTRQPDELAHDREGRAVVHQRGPGDSAAAAYDRARRDLAAIIAACRAAHAEPVLLTYVSDPEYTFETSNRLLRETAARFRVTLVDDDRDLRPALTRPDGSFDAAARNRLFLPDMHPAAPGYRLIAENIVRRLGEDGKLEYLRGTR